MQRSEIAAETPAARCLPAPALLPQDDRQRVTVITRVQGVSHSNHLREGIVSRRNLFVCGNRRNFLTSLANTGLRGVFS